MSKREMTGKELAEFLKSVGAEPPGALELDSIYEVDVGVENGLGGSIDMTLERLKEILSFETPNLVAFHAMGGALSDLVKAMATDLATLSKLESPEEREDAAHMLLHKSLAHAFAIAEAAHEAMPCQQDEDSDREPEQPACLH